MQYLVGPGGGKGKKGPGGGKGKGGGGKKGVDDKGPQISGWMERAAALMVCVSYWTRPSSPHSILTEIFQT